VTATPGEPPSSREAARRRPAGNSSAADPLGGQPAATPIPYEQARDQLAEVVRKLESGGLTLEQSLELWERGERLATICSDWLEGARARLTTALPDQETPDDPSAPF